MAGARVLVIKQAGTRAFVEAEPAFAAIRAQHRDSTIDLLTAAKFGRLAKASPYFDRVLAAGPFETKEAQKHFIGQLRRMDYETIYDLDGSRATLDIKAALTGFRGPRWVGPKRVMSRPGRGGATFTGPGLRKMLADYRIRVPQRLPNLGWATSDPSVANTQPSWFGVHGPYVLFLPSEDPARRWSPGHYASLAEELSRFGFVSVMPGPESMRGFAEQTAGLVSRKGISTQFADLTGKADLAQTAMLARQAHFFVAGVTGEAHLAASVGCPGLLLHHPSDAAEADAFFGREVIKLTGPDIAALTPEMAVNMLRNMGLLTPPVAAPGRAFA